MAGPPRKASGRVIRSGSRRLKGPNVFQTGGLYPVIPAYGEQVSRFMQVLFSFNHIGVKKNADVQKTDVTS
jgi:hypothetical protein